MTDVIMHIIIIVKWICAVYRKSHRHRACLIVWSIIKFLILVFLVMVVKITSLHAVSYVFEFQKKSKMMMQRAP